MLRIRKTAGPLVHGLPRLKLHHPRPPQFEASPPSTFIYHGSIEIIISEGRQWERARSRRATDGARKGAEESPPSTGRGGPAQAGGARVPVNAQKRHSRVGAMKRVAAEPRWRGDGETAFPAGASPNVRDDAPATGEWGAQSNVAKTEGGLRPAPGPIMTGLAGHKNPATSFPSLSLSHLRPATVGLYLFSHMAKWRLCPLTGLEMRGQNLYEGIIQCIDIHNFLINNINRRYILIGDFYFPCRYIWIWRYVKKVNI